MSKLKTLNQQLDEMNLDFEGMQQLSEILEEKIQDERIKRATASLFKMEDGVLREKTEDELLDEMAEDYFKEHQFDDIGDVDLAEIL